MPPSYICTYTGRKVFVSNPSVDTIEPIDIAHALSNLCRYTGHCGVFYSVASHCMAVADLLAARGASEEIQLAGLCHDAPEAYLGDVSAPLKQFLPDYQLIEARMYRAVFERVGSPFVELPESVKIADFDAFVGEVHNLFGADAVQDAFGYIGKPKPDVVQIVLKDPWKARDAWFSRYVELGGRL